MIGREVRDTDCSATPKRARSRSSCSTPTSSIPTRVIDRLVSRIENYEFPTRAADRGRRRRYPTHAVDADSLKRQAMSHPIVNWRGGSARRRSELRSTP